MSETTDKIRQALAGVPVATRRARTKLSAIELDAAMTAITPAIENLERALLDAQQGTTAGPAWVGITHDGERFSGEQKKEVLLSWQEARGIPSGAKLLSTTVGGTQQEGERVRGNVYFYTYPATDQRFWLASSAHATELPDISVTDDNDGSTAAA